MTGTALADLVVADLTMLGPVAIMIDGVHFADTCAWSPWESASTGLTHPLALVQGSTEDTTLVRDLLVGPRDRGLDVTRPILAVLDGAKALSAAVREVFDHPVLDRCQLHQIRNDQDHLPEKLRGLVRRRVRQAYHADSALQAEACWRRWPPSSTRPIPAPLAATVRDGRDVDCAPSRDHARNVKRWRDGQMALRCGAAGMLEASKQFRRVNGHLPALRTALTRQVGTESVTNTCHDQELNAA